MGCFILANLIVHNMAMVGSQTLAHRRFTEALEALNAGRDEEARAQVGRALVEINQARSALQQLAAALSAMKKEGV